MVSERNAKLLTGGREVEMIRKYAMTIAAVALVAAATLPASLVAQAEATTDTKPEIQISVHVDNGNWLDMKVYAMRDGGVYHRI